MGSLEQGAACKGLPGVTLSQYTRPMSFTNDRGQYGALTGVVASPSAPSSHSMFVPWLLGGAGLAVVGLALFGAHTAKRPRLSAHEAEMRAWKAEFPGLPWYMDEVKDSRQLDLWERARDHWEKTH